ncbi:hypothetical protein ACH4D4_19460 [Streptomyces pristinaespiralis]|uniref:hypothetical protein n=1 Tax=Streptomyces pristinaespiralis TaxID=38300 RepID=UPI0037998AB9
MQRFVTRSPLPVKGGTAAYYSAALTPELFGTKGTGLPRGGLLGGSVKKHESAQWPDRGLSAG